jgi:hypothetical protein
MAPFGAGAGSARGLTCDCGGAPEGVAPAAEPAAA